MPEDFDLERDYTETEHESRKKKIRNLHQYKNMSDEDFEVVYQNILDKSLKNPSFERRIKEEQDRFAQDYDISDLKINDKNTLRALIQAVIALEDYEQAAYKLQREALTSTDGTQDSIYKLERINKITTVLRNDISRFQEDLKITRKIRKGDREESVNAFVEDLKIRARKFYESRMARIFCPTCKTLIGTAWVLYQSSSKNKFWFHCDKCGETIIISYPELLKSNLRNIDGVPEF